jgi:hypothetical protein
MDDITVPSSVSKSFFTSATESNSADQFARRNGIQGTFRELFITEYSGRLDWRVAIFGAFIGIIAISSLEISCYQAVLGRKQVNLAIQISEMVDRNE